LDPHIGVTKKIGNYSANRKLLQIAEKFLPLLMERAGERRIELAKCLVLILPPPTLTGHKGEA
jgi:hypothetical protein